LIDLCLPPTLAVLQLYHGVNKCYIVLKKSNNKITELEQSYKWKVKTHKYINRQNQSTTENCENRNDPDLVQVNYINLDTTYKIIRNKTYWLYVQLKETFKMIKPFI
jgi:hypothetical protein